MRDNCAMALLRLIAEGIGPFQRLDLDFSDGNGRPRLGPHILAGVNGSGKSTVLRAIAWALEKEGCGFDDAAWKQLTLGQGGSRVLAIMRHQTESGAPYALGRSVYPWYLSPGALEEWAESQAQPLSLRGIPGSEPLSNSIRLEEAGLHPGREQSPYGVSFNVAAYAPSTQLAWIDQPNLTATIGNHVHQSLAFQGTVQNAAIQAWLLGLYSKRAIARDRNQSTEHYSRSLSRFEAALRLLYGEDVRFDVDIEPHLQPLLRMRNHALNFSQLPDGVRSTVGWVADFMMRQDAVAWSPELEEKRPGILLLDEVDAHLHPRWQRLLLPAMREALPNVQIIATSHSPFVISSCPDAVIHVLEVGSDGVATNRPPEPSPVGASIMTTLKDIFGVDSRFDVQTERELNEWNELSRRVAAGKISPDERSRLSELTAALSNRSEELRSIVGSAVRSSDAMLDALLHR